MILPLVASLVGPVLGCSQPPPTDPPAVEVTVATPALRPPVPPPSPPTPPAEALLAEIDAILARVGGERRAAQGSFCVSRGGPFAENRNAVCDHADTIGSWTLWAPHPGEEAGVAVTLSQHRFRPEQRQHAIDRALAQVGTGTGHHHGGISWCHAQLTWQQADFWGLDRSCGVSIHVGWAQDVLHVLRQAAVTEDGAIGVLGHPGGWATLMNPAGEEHHPPRAATERIRMRVVDVAPDDVLWLRDGPPNAQGTLAAKHGQLPPDARCVPMRMHPPGDWILVTAPTGEPGWAHARYLKPEPPGACLELPAE